MLPNLVGSRRAIRIVPISAGLDKFFNDLTNREVCLNSLATKVIPLNSVSARTPALHAFAPAPGTRQVRDAYADCTGTVATNLRDADH